MADSEQALQDNIAISRAARASGVNTRIPPPRTGDEGGETPFSEVDGYLTNSYTLDHETTCDDAQHSARNGCASTRSVFPSNDGCVHAPSLSIGAVASPFIPEDLIEAYNITNRLQKQDDLSLKYIDPRLLYIPHPADHTTIETALATQPDLGILPAPTSAPVISTHPDGNYTDVTSICHQLSPPLSEAPAQHASGIPSRGRNHNGRTQTLSPRYKRRRAKPLESLTQQSLYHSLPTADWEYFGQVVTKLSHASHLVSPQSLEPTVGSLDGHLLIGPRRSIGPGAAAARESVYAVLVDRPSKGAYVCWICGEKRADRRLVRALDHVRVHFNHRPYHCSENHFDRHTEPASSLPLASVCGQSFTCAEGLKDHQVKMKNTSHICATCEKPYTSSGNLKRHMRKEHPS